MKITKRQLRRIIREERARLVSEAPRTDGRGNKDANHKAVKEELYNVLEMMENLSRIELEELRDIRTGHTFDETINKLADIVLVSRMDSAYMGG